jgi:hypothetical protein
MEGHAAPVRINYRRYAARLMRRARQHRGLYSHWAGGLPEGTPPRPGTPEYDAFRQKQEAQGLPPLMIDKEQESSSKECLTLHPCG